MKAQELIDSLLSEQKTKVLFLDDNKNRYTQYCDDHPDYDVTYVGTAKAATKRLGSEKYDIVTLDHDLYLTGAFKGNGKVVAQFIADGGCKETPPKIVIHSMNLSGAKKMKEIMKGNVPGSKISVKPFNPDGRRT